VSIKRGWHKALILVLALTMMMAGCGGKPQAVEEEEPDPTPPFANLDETEAGQEEEPEPEPEAEPEEEIIYPYTYPLTGLGAMEEVKDRPILVLVENHKDARPQSGLINADIVYEILVEGEITRFAAIYHSEKPEVIGPIRSLRPYFAEIGAGWDALIVHAGYSPAAIELVKNRGLDHLDEIYGDGAYYWRSTERSAPHNLYSSIEKLRSAITKKKIRSEWKQPKPLKFADSKTVIQGDPAGKVHLTYLLGYTVEYVYDAEAGVYKRYMAGQPHVDKETGEQITAANVLIVQTSHSVIDNEGRRNVNVTGPGTGWLVQQGKVREVKWEQVDGVIRPYIDGSVVPLLPGKTWVQFIPHGYKVTFSDAR